MQDNKSEKPVVLLFPPVTVEEGSVKKCDLPLGLAYIASYLEKNGHNVCCIDISLEGYENEEKHNCKITFGLNDGDVKTRIRGISPKIVGISFPYSLQFNNLVRTSKLVKEVDNNILVVVGGVHPTFGAKNILKENKSIDIIVLNEGEETFLEIVRGKPLEEIDGIAYRKDEEIIINKIRKPIRNIDDIPFPARHLFKMEKYIEINLPHNHFPKKKMVASIITSRGCTGHCTFCSSHLFWGSYIRYRSVDNVIAEIKELIETYNIQEIQFLDDNLTGWEDRAKELFKRMKGLNIAWCTPNGVRLDTIDEEMLKLMKESGCYRLTYAPETGNQSILTNVIKKTYDLKTVKPIVDMTKKIGISIHTFWIIGLPNETREQMWNTFEFAKSLKIESASFCLATPMIGTELLEMCKKDNLLREEYDSTISNYRKSYIKNPEMSSKELENLCDYFNSEINKGLLWRNPVAFFKKYYVAVLRNPRRVFNLFRKFG